MQCLHASSQAAILWFHESQQITESDAQVETISLKQEPTVSSPQRYSIWCWLQVPSRVMVDSNNSTAPSILLEMETCRRMINQATDLLFLVSNGFYWSSLVTQNSGWSANLLHYMLPNFELSVTLAKKKCLSIYRNTGQSFKWPAFSVLNSDPAHDISTHNLFWGALLCSAKTSQDKARQAWGACIRGICSSLTCFSLYYSTRTCTAGVKWSLWCLLCFSWILQKKSSTIDCKLLLCIRVLWIEVYNNYYAHTHARDDFRVFNFSRFMKSTVYIIIVSWASL